MGRKRMLWGRCLHRRLLFNCDLEDQNFPLQTRKFNCYSKLRERLEQTYKIGKGPWHFKEMVSRLFLLEKNLLERNTANRPVGSFGTRKCMTAMMRSLIFILQKMESHLRFAILEVTWGKKIKLGPYLIFCTMVNSKWIKDFVKNKITRRKCKIMS